jgi:hypothetical protein
MNGAETALPQKIHELQNIPLRSYLGLSNRSPSILWSFPTVEKLLQAREVNMISSPPANKIAGNLSDVG